MEEPWGGSLSLFFQVHASPMRKSMMGSSDGNIGQWADGKNREVARAKFWLGVCGCEGRIGTFWFLFSSKE
jgi:hypothetical protein